MRKDCLGPDHSVLCIHKTLGKHLSHRSAVRLGHRSCRHTTKSPMRLGRTLRPEDCDNSGLKHVRSGLEGSFVLMCTPEGITYQSYVLFGGTVSSQRHPQIPITMPLGYISSLASMLACHIQGKCWLP